MAKRATRSASPHPERIGDHLRGQRVNVLEMSLRDMAKLVECAPIHLSDIETGKRSPSEELLVRMAKGYKIPEAELRAGFAKPDSIVGEVASDNAVSAEKVPALLRVARGMNAAQWDQLIKQAKKINESERKGATP